MKVAIHITDETFQKTGGIGSVIQGMCSAGKYKNFFDQTLLYGPLFEKNSDVFSLLGKGARVIYSSKDNYDTGNYHERFAAILAKYNIDIVYGKRYLASQFDVNKNNEVDVILLDINNISKRELNNFKFWLWEHHQISSDKYDYIWDYEQYVRVAVAYKEIVTAFYPMASTFYHFAHNYEGIPACLQIAADNADRDKHKLIFYAHQTEPLKELVSHHPGHDITVYNVINENIKANKVFRDQYPGEPYTYQEELIKRTVKCDAIYAVGEYVKEECQYLIGPEKTPPIKTVYHGIPLKYIIMEEKFKKRELVKEYIQNLFGFSPDYIFTHITHMSRQKGLWRDINFLYYLDKLFTQYNFKGIYILLSTLLSGARSSKDISNMEAQYGWPVNHKEGWPDLIDLESDTYRLIREFNEQSKMIKALFINQNNFNKRLCGNRVPGMLDHLDLRIASDAEFDFSIYDPSGTTLLEVIPYGGIGVLSSSCGCAHFLNKIFEDSTHKPFCIFPFVEDGPAYYPNKNMQGMNEEERQEIEKRVLERDTKIFFDKLPKSDDERIGFLEQAQEHLSLLGWEHNLAYLSQPLL